MPYPRFRDRFDAGRLLTGKLAFLAGQSDLLVLALPRGGVPVAYEIAQSLGAPLDIFTVRKLGVPGHEELAMGAIASGGVRVLNEDVVRTIDIPAETIDRVAQDEQRELQRRERAYRGERAPPQINGKTVILVDDGLATGATMRAAARALRQMRPSRLIIAVPVGAPDTCADLQAEVDEVVCLVTPEPFQAVGLWYQDFSQTTDREVAELLERANRPREQSPASSGIGGSHRGSR
jgi:putative phosphoribosyl transferase